MIGKVKNDLTGKVFGQLEALYVDREKKYE